HVCDGTLGEGADGEPTCDGTWVYDKARSHVDRGDAPEFIRNLSVGELDALDPAYLRFVNPGDLRVAGDACGPCHTDIVERVRTSTMAHSSGEVTVARYRAGAQDEPYGVYGAAVIEDPNYMEAAPCGVEALAQLLPRPLEPGSGDPSTELTIANAQDQYMAKSCMRCHLTDFGENRFRADFRSSGCTACHMQYNDDGLSQSEDPRISRETVPHAATHELTATPPIQQCTHCHYRGGRLGISFQGYRESAGAGLNPPAPEVLGVAQHGHDAAYYLTDEDTTNDFDETPADVHFEAGMDCVDCHTEQEVHGDGHIYADTQCAVGIECTDCHGTGRARAVLDPEGRPNFYERDGTLYLRTKISDLELVVPQVIDAVTPGSPTYTELAARSMGVSTGGFSHSDDLECYTCHAAFVPSCYGCHVTLDLDVDGRLHGTGELTPGRPSGGRRWVVLNDLVLMRNSDGQMAPSMPAERFFMTVTQGGAPTKIRDMPREFVDGSGRVMPGFGQRAMNPHSTRRRSQFMACDRCHSVGDPSAPDNAVLLDLTHGFGTDRFMEEACDVTNADDSCDPTTDVTTYRLDAIQTRTNESLVVVGHPDPMLSRPLNADEIMRMRTIVVAPDEEIRTEIPADAATDPWWPRAQNLEP
ncbi:MAG: cytochrome c3 family protein, partial [Deltaproteobacteria bacterium]|nr:cytochrome c3 family protein [Deltaproteobacteria bacterium]